MGFLGGGTSLPWHGNCIRAFISSGARPVDPAAGATRW
jgi:hypothetical protein